MSKYTFAPIVPLIGGFPLGAEAAFDTLPSAIYSYDGFWGNDRHYVQYMQETRGHKEIEYLLFDKDCTTESVDVVIGTPPCAGLSMFNPSKDPAAAGANCAKNDWMYKVFEDGIDKLGAKVIAVENAPALYTTRGAPVAEKLYEICKARGYSMTLYKTSTKFHGIPQARDRTFAFAWKSEHAPILGYYNRDKPTFKDHVANIPAGTPHADDVINKRLGEDFFYQFIRSKSNRDIRDLMQEDGTNTTLRYVVKNGLLREARDWFEAQGMEKATSKAEHVIKKHEAKLNVWDVSMHVWGETHMNALIARTLEATLHPAEDRGLSLREALHIMGFPHDYVVQDGIKSSQHVTQNVPVCTARDMCLEIKKFLDGDLQVSNGNFVKQSNYKQSVDEVRGSEKATLEAFM